MFGEKKMLFRKKDEARRPPKAESWHEAHFEAHGEEINLPPRFKGPKNFSAYLYLCTSVFAPCICMYLPKYKFGGSIKNHHNNHRSWLSLMKISKGSRSLWEDVQQVGKLI